MSDLVTNSEVITAFVDNEAFDPDALARALAEPAGRDLLIDFIALRHVVSEDGAVEQAAAKPLRSHWRELVAAAAVVAALAGGYLLGRGHIGPGQSSDDLSAPQPTRVVDLRPGVEWQPVAGGR